MILFSPTGIWKLFIIQMCVTQLSSGISNGQCWFLNPMSYFWQQKAVFMFHEEEVPCWGWFFHVVPHGHLRQNRLYCMIATGSCRQCADCYVECQLPTRRERRVYEYVWLFWIIHSPLLNFLNWTVLFYYTILF